MEERSKKVITYLLFGCFLLFLEAIFYQLLINTFGEHDKFMGIPFNSSMFLFGFFMMVFMALMYVLFPRTKKKIEKKTKL